MKLKGVVGVKLLEQDLAQHRLSKYISCHNNYYHGYHCIRQTSSHRHHGLSLSGDKGTSSTFGISSADCLVVVGLGIVS